MDSRDTSGLADKLKQKTQEAQRRIREDESRKSEEKRKADEEMLLRIRHTVAPEFFEKKCLVKIREAVEAGEFSTAVSMSADGEHSAMLRQEVEKLLVAEGLQVHITQKHYQGNSVEGYPSGDDYIIEISWR